MSVTWASILTFLGIVNAAITLYRAVKGTNKDEMTYFRDEVMQNFSMVREDIDRQSARLDAHLETGVEPKPRAKKRKPLAE